MTRLCWYLALLTLLTLSGCSQSVDPAMYARFQAAQDQFESASTTDEFLKSAAIYQEILDSGVVSGAVLYNQGNAFMRGGQRGRAVASYRQAKRYRPRDPYLDANLRFAMGENRQEPSKPLIQTVIFWSNWIGYSDKFRISLFCALVTFCVSVASLFVAPTAMKRVAAVSLFITLAMVVSAAYDWYRFNHVEHGVVIADEVIARKGDSESYEPAFTKALTEGTEFRALDQRNGWVQIRLEASQDGWLPAKDVVVY